MKKLITILIAGLFTLASYGQSGVLRGPGGLWIGNATTLTPVFKIGVTPITTTAAQFNYLNTLTSNVQTQLNDDVDIDTAVMLTPYSHKLNPTFTGIPAAPTAAVGTNTTQIATTAFVLANQQSSTIKGLQALGSTIKAFTLGYPYPPFGGYADVIYAGNLSLTAVYLDVATTLTGVKFVMALQGNYTASNYNKVALFSVSGGTLTLVASSTDDGNLFKAATGTMVTKAFSSTYAAAAGIYYVSTLYNNSAEVTAPKLQKYSAGALDAINISEFSDSKFISGQIWIGSTLGNVTASGCTPIGDPLWVAVY